MVTRRTVWLGTGIVLILALTVIFYLYTHNPNEGKVLLPCFFHALTGLWCPGCGATRAFYALLHLNFAEALHKNALLILVGIPSVAYVVLRQFLQKPRFSARGRHFFFVFFILVTMLFTILRNIPIYPLNMLAP